MPKVILILTILFFPVLSSAQYDPNRRTREWIYEQQRQQQQLDQRRDWQRQIERQRVEEEIWRFHREEAQRQREWLEQLQQQNR